MLNKFKHFFSLCLALTVFCSCSDDGDCSGDQCDPDGCHGTCDGVCVKGTCYPNTCQPDCNGMTCGDDGCGGSCGSCGSNQECSQGSCIDICIPKCDGKACGDDGCGGSCGSCPAGSECGDFGKCYTGCAPKCGDSTCGDNGCGGSCGSCSSTTFCTGKPASCSTPLVAGNILLERQNIGLNKKNIPEFTNITEEPASGVLVALYDENLNKLGESQSNDDGAFSIPLSRFPKATDVLFIVPAWFVDNQLQLIATKTDKYTTITTNNSGQTVLDYNSTFTPWSWFVTLGNFGPDLGHPEDIVISIENGSGALFAYTEIRKAFINLVDYGFANKVSSLPTMNLAWKPGLLVDYWKKCSCKKKDSNNNCIETTCDQLKTCYLVGSDKYCIDNVDGLGTSYTSSEAKINDPDIGKYTLATSIRIDGNSRNEGPWGIPTLLHEFGHYVLAQRRDDSAGGSHAASSVSAPTLAWSEGWASFYSNMTLSYIKNELVTDYWRLLGTSGSFWLDYSKIATQHGAYEKPDSNDPNQKVVTSLIVSQPSMISGLKQNLSESWITAFLLDVWDGADFNDLPHTQDPIAVSTSNIWKTLDSTRYKSPDSYNTNSRTVPGVDLVDFIDALICNNIVDKSTFVNWILNSAKFPYDDTPVCSK